MLRYGSKQEKKGYQHCLIREMEKSDLGLQVHLYLFHSFLKSRVFWLDKDNQLKFWNLESEVRWLLVWKSTSGRIGCVMFVRWLWVCCRRCCGWRQMQSCISAHTFTHISAFIYFAWSAGHMEGAKIWNCGSAALLTKLHKHIVSIQ
jgi:hypothetical protein